MVQEYMFYVLGFVPVDVVGLNEDVWYKKLNSDQVESVEQFLAESERS